MKNYYFIIVLLIANNSICRPKTFPIQKDLIGIVKSNNILDSNQLYFPITSFPRFIYYYEYKDSLSILVSEYTFNGIEDTVKTYCEIVPNQFDTSLVKWYSQFLYALEEPVLFNSNSTTESYRFTWLRTFHHPIAIRIEKTNNEYWLHLKISSGLGGYSAGVLQKSKSKRISQNQWNEFKELLDKYEFWNLSIKSSPISTDGSKWILEGYKPESYLVIDQKSPTTESSLYQICNYLIELSKLKIKKDTKY